MICEKGLDLRQRVDEAVRKFRVRCFANNDQQCNLMLDDGIQLIGSVTNSFVPGQRNPAIATAMLKPLLVGTVRWKELLMTLNYQPSGREDFGKAFS